jgi:Mor family transcriptional regulator
MVKVRDDIIHDILQKVLTASQQNGGITQNIATQIEHKVRHDWAGSRPYIAHNKEELIAIRNEKIFSAYWDENQRDIKRLSIRFGISCRQIRRIIF